MSFGEAIKSVFSKYATFSGRARRSEFWYFFLLNFIICFVLGFIPFLSWVSGLWSLAILIPFVAVTVRRFHDIGKSGWYYLVPLIPALAYTGYLVYYVMKTVKEVGVYDMDAIARHITDHPSGILAIVVLGLLTIITTIIWIV